MAHQCLAQNIRTPVPLPTSMENRRFSLTDINMCFQNRCDRIISSEMESEQHGLENTYPSSSHSWSRHLVRQGKQYSSIHHHRACQTGRVDGAATSTGHPACPNPTCPASACPDPGDSSGSVISASLLSFGQLAQLEIREENSWCIILLRIPREIIKSTAAMHDHANCVAARQL